MNHLVRVLIESTNWSELSTDSGVATAVPQAAIDLSLAQDEEAAQAAYWKIDNEVIVQGQLYQAAEMTLRVLLLLLPTAVSVAARRGIAELIQQIVCGEPHHREIEAGRIDLGERCRSVGAGAKWLFYGWLLDSDEDIRECAVLATNRIEADNSQRQLFLSTLLLHDPSERVRRTAQRFLD